MIWPFSKVQDWAIGKFLRSQISKLVGAGVAGFGGILIASQYPELVDLGHWLLQGTSILEKAAGVAAALLIPLVLRLFKR